MEERTNSAIGLVEASSTIHPQHRRRVEAGVTGGSREDRRGTSVSCCRPKGWRTVALNPQECSGCRGALVKKAEAPAPWRHQAVEVPPVEPHVTGYQQHCGWLEHCPVRHSGRVVRRSAQGSLRTAADVLVALLSGQYRLSKRLLRQLLADVLGVEVALGSISNLEGQLSTALAGAVEQASEYVRDELEERRVGGRDCRWPSPHG